MASFNAFLGSCVLLLSSSSTFWVSGQVLEYSDLNNEDGSMAVADSSSESFLRGAGGIAGDGLGESTCHTASSKEACFQTTDKETGKSCSWCEAGAIPSECVSQEQANMLPAGVFDCTTPSFSSWSSVNEIPPSFRFVEGKTHRVNAAVVEDEGFCDPDSKSISGYMDITGSRYDADGENKHLFFWMFEKRGSSKDEADFGNDEDASGSSIPFLVWLTGGPGCSSTLALLTENGPCSVNSDGESTSVNPYSWTEAAHVLWLDQPAGVGFSYGEEIDANEEMVAEDAYYFFQAFFQTYPEYADNPLYITGESYAGHYIPAISKRIADGNKALQKESGLGGKRDGLRDELIHLNLSGLAIGNGLTSPEKQYPAYPEMVYNNSHGIKIVNEATYKAMKAVVPACTAMIRECNAGDSMINDFACQSAFVTCNMGLTSPYQATGLNPYDIRQACEKPPLCYDFSHVSKWLHSASTKKALNVDLKHSHSWESCNFGINMKFHSDWMKDFSGDIAYLLDDAKVPALIYVGDVDFICNYIGNEAWTYDLEWNGKAEFQSATVRDWETYGSVRSAQNFTYLTIKDAGHMVPSDQPEVALKMLKIFLEGGDFQ